MLKYIFLTVATFTFLLTACKKNNCERKRFYTYYIPVYKTKDAVRENIKSNNAKEIQNPGKIFLYGNYIFLNEVDRGVHVIDNTNPSSPQNIGFIDIPGNIDIAVKENIMYADMYSDLVAIDISDPRSVVRKKIIEGVFPFRYWGGGFVADNSMVVVDWQKHDTLITYSCDMPDVVYYEGDMMPGVFYTANASASGAPSAPVGQGGSMARFALTNEKLYTVTYSDINVFDIVNPANPSLQNTVNVGTWNIETIFPFKSKLFIGSSTGMYIYSLNASGTPVPEGQFAHMQSCDPVIADDDFAYVTLRSGTACMTDLNQMDVLDIADIKNPELVKTYKLTNPHGLSKDGNLLFVCDGNDGLKIFDATNVSDIKLKKHITGLETYDVIAYRKIAFTVAKDGLYQYDYSNINNIRLLSKIVLHKN